MTQKVESHYRELLFGYINTEHLPRPGFASRDLSRNFRHRHPRSVICFPLDLLRATVASSFPDQNTLGAREFLTHF